MILSHLFQFLYFSFFVYVFIVSYIILTIAVFTQLFTPLWRSVYRTPYEKVAQYSRFHLRDALRFTAVFYIKQILWGKVLSNVVVKQNASANVGTYGSIQYLEAIYRCYINSQSSPRWFNGRRRQWGGWNAPYQWYHIGAHCLICPLRCLPLFGSGSRSNRGLQTRLLIQRIQVLLYGRGPRADVRCSVYFQEL